MLKQEELKDKNHSHQENGEEIPVKAVIEELDALFDKNLLQEAGEFLRGWLSKAREAGDWKGELTIQNELMGYYRKTGEEAEGLLAVREGLELLKKEGVYDTVTGGTTLLNAATTLKAFGHAADAVGFYEEAARIYSSKLSPSDYRFAGLYNNMALAWTDLGEYETAEQMYERALQIMKNLAGGEMELAVTWTNMACLYHVWKEEPEREDMIASCLEKAISYLDDPEVKRDGYYAFTCEKCAGTFGYFGYFLKKKELEERAAAIYEGIKAGKAVL